VRVEIFSSSVIRGAVSRIFMFPALRYEAGIAAEFHVSLSVLGGPGTRNDQ
jgi:hypothetical protein